jgi:nucleoside-diphosphate-sugar epimerase
MDNILLKGVPIEMLEGKTVLLTGATGLIGTHFLYAFRDMYKLGVNLKVIAIGRNDPPEHLSVLLNMPFVQYHQTNLASDKLFSALWGIDVLIHAASYGQPGKFTEYATETVNLNTSVVIDLFKILAKDGKFLFLSSSEVCSGLYDMPIAEDMIGTTTPYHPRACYIESKRCGEAIVNTFRESGVDAKSVRLCLAYGEGTRENDRRVLNELIQKAIKDGNITLKDKGRSVRTYCYVGDAVNMMLRILLEGKQPVYNVGGVEPLSISSLAFLIGEITNTEVSFPDTDEPLVGSPDIVKINLQRYFDEFGSRDFVSMEEGLIRTINYQKNLYGSTTNKK